MKKEQKGGKKVEVKQLKNGVKNARRVKNRKQKMEWE